METRTYRDRRRRVRWLTDLARPVRKVPVVVGERRSAQRSANSAANLRNSGRKSAVRKLPPPLVRRDITPARRDIAAAGSVPSLTVRALPVPRPPFRRPGVRLFSKRKIDQILKNTKQKSKSVVQNLTE